MAIPNLFQYAFIQRAYLAGSFIAVLCAVLGLFLVLRKLSLIGDGLSHVSFGAIALGLFFGWYPLAVAVPLVLLASSFIVKLTEKARMYGDAAIGMVSALGIAGGVILASLSKGFNVDLFSYLFGNILAISTPEVYFSLGLCAAALAIVFLFYHDLFFITFDAECAKISGINVRLGNLIITSLTAITVVLAIKVVGIMLVSALLILPAVAALQIAKGFKTALVLSAGVAVASVIAGITISFYADVPAGAMVVLINFALFGVFCIAKKLGSRLR
jgi:zinc transport system permease protein